MTILNSASDGNLSVLCYMGQFLHSCGGKPKDELIAEFSHENGDVPKQTINRWLQVGFFKEVEGKLELPDDLRDVEGVVFKDALRTSVRRVVFEERNNPEDKFFENNQSLASDFTRTIAWGMFQEPLQFSSCFQDLSEYQKLWTSQFPNASTLNDVWFTQLRRWAEFLGFFEGGVLDCSLAVKGEIDEIFLNASSFIIEENEVSLLPIDKFLSQLSLAIPVIDGGLYNKRVAKAGISLPNWGDEQLSPCLSLALYRLGIEKVISLEAKADAVSTKILDVGHGQTIEVSYVGRPKK